MDYVTDMSGRGSPQHGSAQAEIARLLTVMARLRDPVRGCPWDQVQTFDTIAPYTIEEGYEVADAIARRDWAGLPDELGDLLFQVVYHARMAEEAGLFGFAEVVRAIVDKMVRRHPLVFPNAVPARDDSAVLAGDDAATGWEAQKQVERRARQEHGTLAGVATGIPALSRALKVTARAARVGFDWADVAQVLDKLDEEVAEVRAELPAADPARMADEIGDVLFVAANLARKAGLDPEACLHAATDKFTRRFNAVEERLATRGLAPADAGLAAMEAEWVAVKRDERGAER